MQQMHIASWIAKPSVHAISATVYCTCMLNSPHNSPFVNGHNWSCKNLTLPEFCCWWVLVAFKYSHSQVIPRLRAHATPTHSVTVILLPPGACLAGSGCIDISMVAAVRGGGENHRLGASCVILSTCSLG